MPRVGGLHRASHRAKTQPARRPDPVWLSASSRGTLGRVFRWACPRPPVSVSQLCRMRGDAGRIPMRPHGGGGVKAQGSVLKGSNHIVRLFIVLSF